MKKYLSVPFRLLYWYMNSKQEQHDVASVRRLFHIPKYKKKRNSQENKQKKMQRLFSHCIRTNKKEQYIYVTYAAIR